MFQMQVSNATNGPEGVVTAEAARLQRFLTIGNYAGIGNAILEALLRPQQDRAPDDLSRFFADNIRTVIGHYFAIDPEWTYAMPHHDQLIPYHLRGDWKADTFPMLMIMAYVLGATRVNLPPPHAHLLAYYRKFAAEQTQCILQAAQRYKDTQQLITQAEEQRKQLADQAREAKRLLQQSRREKQLATEASAELARRTAEARSQLQATRESLGQQRDRDVAALRQSKMEQNLLRAEIDFVTKHYARKLQEIDVELQRLNAPAAPSNGRAPFSS